MVTASREAVRYTGLCIDGVWEKARSGQTFDDINPATGEVLATIAAAQPDDVDTAVRAAKQAFSAEPWAWINPTDRGRVLYRIAGLIREHLDELARLEARDVGKLLPDARAEIELCAALLTEDKPAGSSFYEPTLFTDVTPDTTIFQEEVFGPVGVIVPFTSEDEAVTLANQSTYGLAAAVYANDLGTAHRVAQRVEAGMVWINEFNAHAMEMPFGGYKQSGIGKDYSMHALDS